MASGDIKGFYRQKKKHQKGGISKSASASKKKKPSKSGGGATLGATDPQTPALFAHGAFDLTDDYGEDEERLRQFDMDMRYGPCIGLTRLQRWERASSMGLHPQPTSATSFLVRPGPSPPIWSASGTGVSKEVGGWGIISGVAVGADGHK